MLVRIAKFLVLAQLAYGLGLMGNWGVAVSIPFGIAVAAAAALYFSQPDIRAADIRGHSSRDRLSALMVLLAGLVCHAMPVWEWRLRGFPGEGEPFQAAQLAGLLLVLFGLGWRIYAIRYLGRFFSATVHIRRDHELIQTGPYHWSRHPSYLGAWVAMVGHALVLAAPVSAAVVGAMLIPVYTFRILVEEKALAETFGDRYDHYRRSTPRLVPFVW